jgi:hypothetical protein
MIGIPEISILLELKLLVKTKKYTKLAYRYKVFNSEGETVL